MEELQVDEWFVIERFGTNEGKVHLVRSNHGVQWSTSDPPWRNPGFYVKRF